MKVKPKTMKMMLSIIVVLACAGCGGSGEDSPAEFPWDNGPLRVSENGRFLEHENGDPFFLLGDTGWLAPRKLDRAEIETYLENRRNKGYNFVQVMVLHTHPMVNAYGDTALAGTRPFRPGTTPGNNPDDPAEYDYWDHLDYIVETAESKGLYMGLVCVWGSVVKAGHLDADAADDYGTWIAERYKDSPNIIWLNGGDVRGSDKPDVWQALGTALNAADDGHLITFHPFGRTQSSIWFHNEDWLDFNMFQSGHRRYDQQGDDVRWFGEDSWRYVLEDYAMTPPKPTMDGEPSYEGIPQGLHDPVEPYWGADDVRRYAYWSVFAGSCGHVYGHSAVMQMHAPDSGKGAYGVRDYWYDAVDHPGAVQMRHVKALILSRPYFDRIPDQSVIAGAEGEQYDRIIATRGISYLFAYTYTGRAITIAMGSISGDLVRASWFDPRTGAAQEIGMFDNTGTQSFDPPGEERAGNDWVLVLDDADTQCGLPGAAPWKN